MLLSFRLLKKKYKMKIRGIIHIGAHFGQEIPDYIDCGIQDMVMFEPLEENFKVLAEKAKDLKPKVHLTHHPNVKFPETEEVEVNCLDNYDCFNYNFINMDVQGYELEVLKGGKKTLEQVDYVYCEVNRDEVYENNAFVEELDEFLADYNMERVMTSWEGQIWGDALYVRKNLL